MVFLILGIIIGAIIGYDEYYEVSGCILGGIFGLVVGSVIWFIVGIFGCFLPTTDTFERKEIYALNDSSKLEGQKYLFSGYIEENLVYRYVEETNRGKHVEEVDMDCGYIKDIDSDSSPYVEIYSSKFKHKWYFLFFMDWNVSQGYSVFYVPEGTVTNEYDVDLQ